MVPESPSVTKDQARFCPECGIEEPGFFCRKCGALLRGEDAVLCPRCRHVVEAGTYCNQCGQELAGFALSLKQLVLAGEDFWVTDAGSLTEVAEPALVAQASEDTELAKAELPDWLHEFPGESLPAENHERVVPSLVPLRAKRKASPFLTIAVILMALMLAGMLVVVVISLFQVSGWSLP
jgi:hypothetical protein